MLRKVPLVFDGIEKLQDEVDYFMGKIHSAQKWSNNFFQKVFFDSVVKKSPKLKALFQQFFREFRMLPPARKVELLNEFRLHNQVMERCNDTINVTKLWNVDENKAFAISAHKLFVFMYENTLDSKCYETFSGSTLKRHYRNYRDSCVSPMCPFCGLEDYVDLHSDLNTRDAYDHYLHKAEYPFSAINFRNLFPMCTQCNSGAKKTKDVLFIEGTATRRYAPYPPEDKFDIDIQLTNALGPAPHVDIALQAGGCAVLGNKFSTWLHIFSIKARYEGRINQKKQDWLTDILVKVTEGQFEVELKKKLEEAKQEAYQSLAINLQREIHLKAPFFAYCANNIEPLAQFFLETPLYADYIQGRSGSLLPD